MAFANYTDLQTAIKDWLNREDTSTTSKIPDFIVFGENRIFRSLRSRYNEVVLDYPSATEDNAAGITLPPDFKEVKYLLWAGRQLERKSDQWFFSKDPTAAQDTPVFFARTEPYKIEFWRPPDNNADVKLLYYNQQAAISDDNTPDLYLSFPELYLFAALLEAKPFLKATDAQDIATWQAKYDQVFAEIMADSWDAEFAGSTNEVTPVYEDSFMRPTQGKGAYGY